MSDTGDCSQNTDPLKLVREGTDQRARSPKALDPAAVAVDGRDLARNLVFAQNYASLLKYFDSTHTVTGDWRPFFTGDVSAVLATAAIEDLETYSSNTQSWFDYLNDGGNQSDTVALKNRLSYLYGSVGSLARQLDAMKEALPTDAPLRNTLRNLIQTQLAPALGRLITYYRGGEARGLVNVVAPPVRILSAPAVSFKSVLAASPATALSSDWSAGQPWAAYVGPIAADTSVYGPAASAFVQISHCSTHTLFKSAFEQFLKGFARAIAEARRGLEASLTEDTHEPHYTLLLAFLRLLEYARSSGNTLARKHLDFYYRRILGLREKSAQPGRVHLVAELAKGARSHLFKAGEAFKAGKDGAGKDAFFASTADVVANQAKVSALKIVYRHGDERISGTTLHKGRLYASPTANADDGAAAPLTSGDGSWHPFFNKVYADGALSEIRMPLAKVGFAVASHYLLLAEGRRYVTVTLNVTGYTAPLPSGFQLTDLGADFTCALTTEKGWLEKTPYMLSLTSGVLLLRVEISGGDPPIVPYSSKVHGYNFQTDQPVLLLTVNQDATRSYAYNAFEHASVLTIDLGVSVENLKTLAVSNDFGPLDTSKPFQPFGTSPVKGSSLVIGSKEMFQKKLSNTAVHMEWLVEPTVFTGAKMPTVSIDVLSEGAWSPTANAALELTGTAYPIASDVQTPVVDSPDFAPNEFYDTQSRHGFVRLRLSGGIGQKEHQDALIAYLRKDPPNAADPRTPPTGPTAGALSMSYAATTTLALDTSDKARFDNRSARFFHLTPFGTSEQHPHLNGKAQVSLFPRFEFERTAAAVTQTLSSEAELYIGISELAPPQTLSLLFQVADGTANPLAEKPKPHVGWSYLRRNGWVELDKTEVQDGTGALLKSGLVTIGIPFDATKDDTALPAGMHWIRAAVHDRSDAVSRLLAVDAQGLEAVFVDRGNATDFAATLLAAGTISKLEKPDAAVKGVSQPFASFGGRGVEDSQAFFTRVSERLRHKNRAITLWDYERLVLEAFPQIYKVKCLNHTCYEPSDAAYDVSGSPDDPCSGGTYRELAPGHVTIVTIPNLQVQSRRDPLKPFTSLGLLEDIKAFLAARSSGFATLHVKNPQFEEVRVHFALRLRDGFDETYYPNLLRQAITRFLSPWAFAGSGEPSFSGRIYKSVLINFVEEQPYVDYITDFRLYHDVCGRAGTIDLDQVEGTRAVSVLVSVPATKHHITLIKPAQDAPLGETCLCDA